MAKLPRDPITGRMLPLKGTEFEHKKKKTPTVQNVKQAYIAGLNDQGGIERRPSVLADRYLKKQGFI